VMGCRNLDAIRRNFMALLDGVGNITPPKAACGEITTHQ
jgi:hypothetical protein